MREGGRLDGRWHAFHSSTHPLSLNFSCSDLHILDITLKIDVFTHVFVEYFDIILFLLLLLLERQLIREVYISYC